MFQKIKSLMPSQSPLKMRLGEVLLNRRNRLSIFIDKERSRSAPAQRFNPKRAAARKKVENAGADDPVAQTGEDRGLDAVHCRPHSALRRLKPNAAGTAGDYSHGEATGVAAAGWVGSGVVAGDGETPGSLGTVSRDFFFFGRSPFPPQKLFTKSFRSRPTTFSSRFVFGRSTVPPTSKSTPE